MPFASQNHFFAVKTSFSIFFRHKRGKKEKRAQKNIVLMKKQMILTSERHAEHLFTGQNTQHVYKSTM